MPPHKVKPIVAGGLPDIELLRLVGLKELCTQTLESVPTQVIVEPNSTVSNDISVALETLL